MVCRLFICRFMTYILVFYVFTISGFIGIYFWKSKFWVLGVKIEKIWDGSFVEHSILHLLAFMVCAFPQNCISYKPSNIWCFLPKMVKNDITKTWFSKKENLHRFFWNFWYKTSKWCKIWFHNDICGRFWVVEKIWEGVISPPPVQRRLTAGGHSPSAFCRKPDVIGTMWI